MGDTDATERQLQAHVDRRLQPGQRGELLKLAGDRFTLGFEFGKDWVRLRSVKRRKQVASPAVVDTPAPTPPSSDTDTALDKPSLADIIPAVAVGNPADVDVDSVEQPSEDVEPPAPWQQENDGLFTLGSPALLALVQQPDNNKWQLVVTEDRETLVRSVSLERALAETKRWLSTAPGAARDLLEFAQVELEIMQSHADDSALAEQLSRILKLQERLAALALLEDETGNDSAELL